MRARSNTTKRRLCFSPDISDSLRKRRQVFDPVKKKLASLAYPTLRFGIIHPATLLITMKGRQHKFDKASKAEKFVQELIDTDQADTNVVAESNMG